VAIGPETLVEAANLSREKQILAEMPVIQAMRAVPPAA
jgi:hypothetical protein